MHLEAEKLAVIDIARLLAVEPVALECFVESPAINDKMVGYFCPDGEKEDHEAVVVVNADAVVDPRAVVVKPIDADVADRAVAAARGSNHLALGAEVGWVDVAKQREEFLLLVALNDTRTLARGVEEGQYDEGGGADREALDQSPVVLHGRVDNQKVEDENNRKESQEERLRPVVALQRHHRRPEHEALAVALLAEECAQLAVHVRRHAIGDDVDRLAALVVLGVAVRASEEQHTNVTSGLEALRLANGNVQWGQTILVSRLEVRSHRQNVSEGHLGARPHGPVQGCEAQLISHVDVEAARPEELKAQWLVLLRGDVQEARPKPVPPVDVGATLVDKRRQYRVVAVLRREVQRRKSKLILPVDPLGHAVACRDFQILVQVHLVRLRISIQHLHAAGLVPEGGIVDQREAELVLDLQEVQVRLLLEVVHEVVGAPFRDEEEENAPGVDGHDGARMHLWDVWPLAHRLVRFALDSVLGTAASCLVAEVRPRSVRPHRRRGLVDRVAISRTHVLELHAARRARADLLLLVLVVAVVRRLRDERG